MRTPSVPAGYLGIEHETIGVSILARLTVSKFATAIFRVGLLARGRELLFAMDGMSRRVNRGRGIGSWRVLPPCSR